MTSEQPLSLQKVFRFWLPLAATWLLMALEGPIVSAVIARLAEAKLNLAAYGVAFPLAIIVEAPIIMMLSASNALVRDAQSYRFLRAFVIGLNVALTVIMVVLVATPLFLVLALDVVGLPVKSALLAEGGLAILIPWPAAIGFRRFWQGILIRNNLTSRVAWGTVVRLAAMSITILSLYTFANLPGIYVGAISMSVGVCVESFATWLMTRTTIRKVLAAPALPGQSALTWSSVGQFYFHLALTPVISLAVHPLITFFLGRSVGALNSLAVMPVVFSFTFLFTGIALSVQDVVVALLDVEHRNLPVLKRFGILVAGATSIGIAMIVLTPLSGLWFREVSGLSWELTAFAHLPAMIMGIQPGLSTAISFLRGVFVSHRRTRPISLAIMVEILVVILGLYVTVVAGRWVGAIGAATALILGRGAGVAFLAVVTVRFVRGTKKRQAG
jgi:progressive ankylosis protein